MDEMQCHELMYFLTQIKGAIEREENPLVAKYLILAFKLPSGAIELSINTDEIPSKIDYIIESYNHDTMVHNNGAVEIIQLMVV